MIDPHASLVGQYDVVHLRMWAPNIRANDTSALIQHVRSLLSITPSRTFNFIFLILMPVTEPGGYIQWEEPDLVHQRVEGPMAQEFERRINKIFSKAGLDFKYVCSAFKMSQC